MTGPSTAAAAPPKASLAVRTEVAAGPVDDDVARLSMSTLSFQDYVRERMLKRRHAALSGQADPGASMPAAPASSAHGAAAGRVAEAAVAEDRASVLEQRMTESARASTAATARERLRAADPRAGDIRMPGLADRADAALPVAAQLQARHDQDNMLSELRQVKGLIEERFGALAFMEKLQRQPKQALLAQRLLDAGFSPALIRKLGASLPADATDETAWAASVLEHNLVTAEAESPLEDQGGVYALVGATGVGKTTTTAKLAAAFAAKYGAANLGLITLDAYRIGAHEQLRAYGRILGVPVHTAHDRASLDDLLELLAAKKMVLIDTAGMAQRDTRTRELLEMLQHRAIRKLLVVNAASQGETIEDVMVAYRAAACVGVVLSKLDEAVKLGPALDALIRHRLKIVGVANGQRVPEDWHRLSANALVQRALRASAGSAYKLDANDVNLVFTAAHGAMHGAVHGGPGAALHA
ncbi:MAG TPA: flagellar biosynthesis protein FlhF, partial [Burkholderiaceae bacterium]|nr:flagellar biosynthesis protein FlhF [Burkholderiaceae bacterium]